MRSKQLALAFPSIRMGHEVYISISTHPIDHAHNEPLPLDLIELDGIGVLENLAYKVCQQGLRQRRGQRVDTYPSRSASGILPSIPSP